MAQTVRRLGEAIGLGIFDVGARLPSESELAEQLGISAMTLREALAVMREAGYVETRRGRQGGTYVKELALTVPEREAQKRIAAITDEYIEDLTAYRIAIGGESAALAAERAAPEDLTEMRELLERMDAADAFEEFRKCDAAFHVTIASCTRSHRLARAETELQAELNPLMGAFRVGPQARHTTNAQHHEIFAAIEAGDGELARRLMAEHMTSSAAAILGFTRAAASAGS
ncbi:MULTISPECIES: FCD domain-containing protein [unclassified Rhodococcus (in: high G+C Gram-positive bacteria)]|uniref:FadR/GntR family transcriptional regulator n=1 Tax=unclassified Rhodococcus (in: high G+C Gram-positive bacteria) TaxID=192944 RepID=UPI001639A539|nr:MULTISPECIES: FCD domain-containing protein [unclassified Rhodococcus (in: high G+C Gram-positive bacteria)]MBC2637812.1 FadR family transcriptional regulator [Rhodococcus sp. 3A]MBC2897442.1 FadR family transcriptional regulator [Rhodococcus sp. 4CII]